MMIGDGMSPVILFVAMALFGQSKGDPHDQHP